MSDQRAESIADQVGQLKAEIERLKAEAEGNYKAAKYAQGRVDELLQTNAALETALKEEKAVADTRKAMADNWARRAEGLELQVRVARNRIQALVNDLTKRRAMEPNHSAYSHLCEECESLAEAKIFLQEVTERRVSACNYVRSPEHGGKTLMCRLEEGHGGLHHAVYAGSDVYFETYTEKRKCPSTYRKGEFRCEKEDGHVDRVGDVPHVGGGQTWLTV